jgi:Mg/Co/Ni transporter MgtE
MQNLLQTAKRAIEMQDAAEMTRLFEKMAPADLADLVDILEADHKHFLFALLEPAET